MFRVQPAARLENIKEIKSSVKLGRTPIVGGAEDVEIRLELTEPTLWDDKRSEFLVYTNTQVELKNTVMLLVGNNETVEELLPEIVRSEKVLGDVDERNADHVVAQYPPRRETCRRTQSGTCGRRDGKCDAGRHLYFPWQTNSGARGRRDARRSYTQHPLFGR